MCKFDPEMIGIDYFTYRENMVSYFLTISSFTMRVLREISFQHKRDKWVPGRNLKKNPFWNELTVSLPHSKLRREQSGDCSSFERSQLTTKVKELPTFVKSCCIQCQMKGSVDALCNSGSFFRMFENVKVKAKKNRSHFASRKYFFAPCHHNSLTKNWERKAWSFGTSSQSAKGNYRMLLS